MTSHQAVELDKERLLCFLRKMLEIRMFEERSGGSLQGG
jgi:TPP-dependent pyruvate/acetoin dehydrogenase alpha subunit